MNTTEYKVLITTSGVGSRLGRLTDYTNKSLIRIGDKPAIGHIIESYPFETKFVITLGHYGDHIKQFLTLVYPERSFEFVDVDNYKGRGSSLVYSILQAKELLQCPFIFNACDTIIGKEDSIPSPMFNYCVGAQKDETSQYTTLWVDDKKITKINQKGEITFDHCYVGICGVNNYKLFWKELDDLHKKFPNKSSLFDGDVINRMLRVDEFELVKLGNWYDIGNTSELENTRKAFKCSVDVLDKLDESIYLYEDFVVKFFYNKQIIKNRVYRASVLNGLVPKVLSHSDNFYKYEMVEGKLLATSVNVKTFKRFLNWSMKNLWKTVDTNINLETICERFYFDKTYKRIALFFGEDVKDEEMNINGEAIPPINVLMKQIDKKWLCSGTPCRIHGDFILDNVLSTSSEFTLLDWRQDFGGELEVGDLYYDLAKLNHNLMVNHDIVNRGLFTISYNNGIKCDILCNSTLRECQEVLHQFVIKNGYDLNKVKVLTALIWINMAPLHEYPFNKFLFHFGKYHLYKALKEVNLEER
jgi:NDP-sugar pyrophosphorylase family protein